MLWGLRPPGEKMARFGCTHPNLALRRLCVWGSLARECAYLFNVLPQSRNAPTCIKVLRSMAYHDGPAPRTPLALRRRGGGDRPAAPGSPLSSGTGTRPLALRCAPVRPTYGFMCAVFSCPTPHTPRPVPPYAEALARPKVIVNVVALIVNDVALIVNDTGASWRSRVPNAGRAGPCSMVLRTN